MNADQRFLAIGIYINSALYLTGVFVAGLVTSHKGAWVLSLFTFGWCYFSYAAQVIGLPHTMALFITACSVASGILAGLALLV